MLRMGTYRMDADGLQTAFDLLRETVARGELPVALLAVANGRETVRCEAYGPDGGLGTDGIYLVASISKPVVGTAILQLVERGRLLIEDPVVKHIPEFGVNGKEEVTIWHLLTHTSGMADDYWYRLKAPPTAESELAGALGTHLRFAPGSRYEYCNVSFTVLGEVIRRARGLGFQDYLQEQVFGPAGMVDSFYGPDPVRWHRVVPVHDFPQVPGGFDAFVATALPAGGLFSTAADLVAFGQAFLNGGMGRRERLLGPAAVRVMTSIHTESLCSYETGSPTPAYYGLAWQKANPREARLISPSGFGHGGMTGTYLWIEPEADLAVVFLTNHAGSDGRARKRIVNAVLGALE